MNIAAQALAEHEFLTADIQLKSRSGQNRKQNIILYLFKDKVYAYNNLCMHMQRPLNCQADSIFDRDRQHLRCSMHGFVFEPETGTCLSPVCAGQKLQEIKLQEENGQIGLQPKQGEITAVYYHGKRLS